MGKWFLALGAALAIGCSTPEHDRGGPPDAAPPVTSNISRARWIAATQDAAGPRYDFRERAEGFVSLQPRYRTASTIHGGALHTQHLDLGWDAGLAFRGVARGDVVTEHPVTFTAQRGNRIDHQREGGVVESYVNGPLGLEQRFRIESRPAGPPALAIRVEVELTGDLEATSDDAIVSLTDDAGEARAYITELAAEDATGRQLTAWFSGAGSELAINVDDINAQYPIEIDPLVFTFQQRLLDASPAQFDWFGFDVAIDGTTLVVGEPMHDGPFPDTGAAHVFTLSGSTWVEQQVLTASDGEASDKFGDRVAVSGDTIVVGAYWDADLGQLAGSAYVFTRTGTTWTQTQKLLASDGTTQDQFGIAVAIEGDTIVVGAQLNQEAGFNAGAAYVFQRVGAAWVQSQKLIQPGCELFGHSVGISGNLMLIGAPGENVPFSGAGAAYVFSRAGATWSMQQRLQSADVAGGDLFGWVSAIDGNTAVIASIVDDDLGVDSGSAYVFNFDGTSWSQQQKLTGVNTNAGDQFGRAVDIDDEIIVIGAPDKEGGPFSSPGWGRVYAFARNGTVWTQQDETQVMVGSDSARFGWSVGLSGATVVSGAHRVFNTVYDAGSAEVYGLVNNDADACLSDLDCAAGTCVDGYCCNDPCAGACNACSVLGSEGICTVLVDGATGAPSCSPYLCNGLSAACPGTCVTSADCSAGNYCNGAGFCVPKGADGTSCSGAIECSSNLCVDAVCCNSACGDSCDACNLAGNIGQCTLRAYGATGAPSCSPYLCNGLLASCPSGCTIDADCLPAFYCAAGGQCVGDGALGDACSADNQCASGFCADGVCCNAVCGDACDACNLAGSIGQCELVSHGDAGTPSCSLYVCDGAAAPCPVSCASDIDCVTGAHCDVNSVCVSDGQLGSPCTAAMQCESGFCTDGVCCDTACGASDTADCQACSTATGAAVSGTCSPLEATTVCRAALGECDEEEHCDGVAPSCPIDALVDAGVECRSSTTACDSAEVCSGSEPSCPEDAAAPNGTSCDDGDSCTGGDECVDGECESGMAGCGGSGGTPGAGGQGGDPAQGGMGGGPPSAGGGGGGPTPAEPDEGCSCSSAGQRDRAVGSTVACLLLGLAFRRRRSAPSK